MKYQYGAEDNKPDYIPAGVYPATIIESEECVSTNGNTQIKIKWEVDSPRWRITDRLVFVEQCQWRIDTFLKSVGMAPDNKKEIEINAPDLLRARAYVQVAVDPPDASGKIWNSVAKYITDKGLPPDKEEKDSNPTEEVKSPVAEEKPKTKLPF